MKYLIITLFMITIYGCSTAPGEFDYQAYWEEQAIGGDSGDSGDGE